MIYLDAFPKLAVAHVCRQFNQDGIDRSLNMAMANVYDWTVQSKLTINALKTKSMLIGSKQNVTSNALNIVINNDIIDQVTSHKCLDVITDEALTWSPPN